MKEELCQGVDFYLAERKENKDPELLVTTFDQQNVPLNERTQKSSEG